MLATIGHVYRPVFNACGIFKWGRLRPGYLQRVLDKGNRELAPWSSEYKFALGIVAAPH